MRRRHDGADAGLAFRHGGERNPGAENAFLKKLARKIHSQFSVAEDDGSNGRLAGRCGFAAYVETEQGEFFFPEARVLPQFFNALRFVFQNIESRDAGCGHRRRMRGGKQEWSGVMVKELDEIARAANVSTERADGLRQSSHLNVHSPMDAEMVNGTPPVAAENARCMRVIHHHDGAVFLGEVAKR